MSKSSMKRKETKTQNVGDNNECGSSMDGEETSGTSSTHGGRTVSKRDVITSLILFYINMINFMDRSTVSGILPEIKKFFEIKDKQAGLLITVFICSYMIFAPIFGYLGDRYSRKYLIAVGISIWSCTTFAGSQMSRTQFLGFLALRGFVGIGEASFSILAPTIIADIFSGDHRTKALTLFNFAMPFGSGLGYIVGSQTAAATKRWQWALRLTPALGIIAVILTLIFIQEPKRGGNDGISDLESECSSLSAAKHGNYFSDIKKVMKVKSFVWSTVGFTCVSFSSGALAMWAPAFVLYAEMVHDKDSRRTIGQVSYIFGIVVIVAGVVGNLLGAEWARRWRTTNAKADSLVCGIGVFIATPCLFFALWTADKIFILSWVIMFIGCVFMFCCWTPTADILLSVVPANCRATAEAIQILLIHVCGDAFSPLIIGAISDAYVGGTSDIEVRHLGLLYSIYTTLVMLCIGAGCYFINACYLFADKATIDTSKTGGDTDITPSVCLGDLAAAGNVTSGKAMMTTVATIAGGADSSYDNPGYSKGAF